MSSINIDTSILVIVLLLFGPAFVFIQATKTIFVAGVMRWHKVDLSRGVKPTMPHLDYLSYAIFPLALAAILAIPWFSNITSLEDLDGNFLETILEPIWLARYSGFIILIATAGYVIGSILVLMFKPFINFMNIQIVNQTPQSELEPPRPRREPRARRNKPNRRQN